MNVSQSDLFPVVSVSLIQLGGIVWAQSILIATLSRPVTPSSCQIT